MIDLPLNKPIYIFTFLLFIIFFIPFFLKRFKIPEVAGYIIAGLIVGPNGLNILPEDSSIKLLGAVGLIYLLFIAGLELRTNQFTKTRNKSIFFGLLTCIIPFFLGMIISIGFVASIKIKLIIS